MNLITNKSISQVELRKESQDQFANKASNYLSQNDREPVSKIKGLKECLYWLRMLW